MSTCERCDSRQPNNPTPIGRRFLDIIAEYRKQTGSQRVPMETIDEAWDIAYNPTLNIPILSRRNNPRGISRITKRKPSFLL